MDAAYACRLRVVDTVTTCHGCHTLDPNGNAEYGVYRPGFFGTSGMYSFESESQIFKIPHLRNAYAKTGMFGVSSNLFLTPNSVLGDRRGGFPSLEGVFMGEQVRGFGFLHDGGVDTLHHFFGSAPFAARPPGVIAIFSKNASGPARSMSLDRQGAGTRLPRRNTDGQHSQRVHSPSASGRSVGRDP